MLFNVPCQEPLITAQFQKIDYSLLNDEESAKSSDSEPEMFDNVLETSARPQLIDNDSDTAEEPTPVKKPPAKRKLGPKPAAAPKRKIDSDSDGSPVKKKVSFRP